MGLITETAYQYYSAEQVFTGDGINKNFTLTFDPLPIDTYEFFVKVGGTQLFESQYSYNSETGVITLDTAPSNGTEVLVTFDEKDFGTYRYILLGDLVRNFMISYVGDGKLISRAKRSDVLFHTKRAIQEFNYDISRVEKIQEVEVGPALTIKMPQDYVNYVALSYVDINGIERPIFPTTATSAPSSAPLQDSDYEFMVNTDDHRLSEGSALTTEWFKNNTSIKSVFLIDEAKGLFMFSSDLSGQIITLKYLSDGLGKDEETKVNKLAEEAIYKYVAHASLSTLINIPEYIVNRFKKDKRSAMRNAKLRLYNLKSREMIGVMRGKSKILKH